MSFFLSPPYFTPRSLGCPFKWIDFSLSECPAEARGTGRLDTDSLSARENEHLFLGKKLSSCSPSPSGGEKDTVKQDPAMPLAASSAGKNSGWQEEHLS